jgi:hypothetical protein
MAALLASVGFGLKAKGDLDSLRATCAPRCATTELDSVKRTAVVSDVFGVIGALGLATGVALLVIDLGAKQVTVGARGALVDLRVTF